MNSKSIDWHQLLYAGPRRPFTADEMARAGSDSPSPTLLANGAINLAAVAFVVLQLAPPSQTARLTAALVALVVLGSTSARWLWWRPWASPLLRAQIGVSVTVALLTFGMCWRVPLRSDREAIAMAMVGGMIMLVTGLWLLVLWRAHQIEGRLREQAEREKSIEMARRLSAAQMEPHFLFNTLASVQHWVQTKDDRAASLLEALTGYLRSTLPLFNRPLVAAKEELTAVERYLQVMQARLGARLAWHIDVDEGLKDLLLPPGMLLTLVENAMEHGVEPKLAGGELWVRGHVHGSMAHFEVVDNGPGPHPAMKDGVGLANIRERLALSFGTAARLTLGPAPAGGFRADSLGKA